MSNQTLACTYAALILHAEGLEITAEKLTTLITAAGLEVDAIYPSIFAKALEGKDIASFLFNLGSGAAPSAGGAVAATSGGAAASKAEVVEEKEEAKEESDDDLGFGLFD